MKYIVKFWKSYNLDKVYFFVFYMAMCFPFVGNFHMTDTQPWALLMAIMFVVIHVLVGGTREYGFYSNAMLSIFILSIVIGCLSMKEVGAYMSLMRSGANYASVFFITMAVYYMLKKQGGLNEGWMKFAILIWLFVGVMQKYVNSGFGRQILSTSRTDVMRGVCSLGAEPSFYGYMCMFFILFAVEFKRLRWLYVGMLVYEIVFLAGSSITLVYLLVFFFMWFIQALAKGRKIGFLMLFLGIAALVGARLVIPDQQQSIRMLELLRKLLYRPDEFISDGSVTQRFESIASAIDQFLSRMGMPSGMSSVRITSGYGALLVELGFVGLFAIVIYFMIMLDGKYGFITAAAMLIIMFSGIQLACPMFSFYLGYCFYKKQERVAAWQLNREDI